MNTLLNDRKSALIEFLQFLDRLGAIDIAFEVDGGRIEAKMTGVYLFNEATNDGPASSSLFVAHGNSKEDALFNLFSDCSGKKYSRAFHKADWRIFSRAVYADGVFPYFAGFANI